MNVRFLFTASFLLAASAVTSLPRPTVAQAAPRHIDVVANRFSYSPAEIALKKGEPVIITLKSSDVAHGIKFKELNLQANIDKGGSGQLTFTPDKAGDFVGHCSIFCGSGHGSMTLTLHVTE